MPLGLARDFLIQINAGKVLFEPHSAARSKSPPTLAISRISRISQIPSSLFSSSPPLRPILIPEKSTKAK